MRGFHFSLYFCIRAWFLFPLIWRTLVWYVECGELFAKWPNCFLISLNVFQIKAVLLVNNYPDLDHMNSSAALVRQALHFLIFPSVRLHVPQRFRLGQLGGPSLCPASLWSLASLRRLEGMVCQPFPLCRAQQGWPIICLCSAVHPHPSQHLSTPWLCRSIQPRGPPTCDYVGASGPGSPCDYVGVSGPECPSPRPDQDPVQLSHTQITPPL